MPVMSLTAHLNNSTLLPKKGTITTVNILPYLQYQKPGADIVCGVPGQFKNIFFKF
jgi:hypothetical protein